MQHLMLPSAKAAGGGEVKINGEGLGGTDKPLLFLALPLWFSEEEAPLDGATTSGGG